MAQVRWVGGSYHGREGVCVTATEKGLVIDTWYDGGVQLEVKPAISWAEIEALRVGALSHVQPATPSRV